MCLSQSRKFSNGMKPKHNQLLMKKSNSGSSIFEAETPKMIKYGHWTLLQIMALDLGTTDSGLIWKFVCSDYKSQLPAQATHNNSFGAIKMSFHSRHMAWNKGPDRFKSVAALRD